MDGGCKNLKIDMKKCNFSEDLAQDRSEWRNKIRVVDPSIVGVIFKTLRRREEDFGILDDPVDHSLLHL